MYGIPQDPSTQVPETFTGPLAHVNAGGHYEMAASAFTEFANTGFFLAAAAATGAYLLWFRDRPEEWEKFVTKLKGKGRRKKKGVEAASEVLPPKPDHAPAAPLTAEQVQELVDRRVAEALAGHGSVPVAGDMSVSNPTVVIPAQRRPEAPGPMAFEKAPESPEELFDDHLAPPVQEAPQGVPVAPQRLRLPDAPEGPIVRQAPPVAVHKPRILKDIDGPLEPDPEEKRLMEALSPGKWRDEATKRGIPLAEIEDEPVLTPAGIEVLVKLNGKLNLSKFQEEHETVRAMLRVKDEMATDITKSGISGWAKLSIRSRTACEDMIPWFPGAPLAYCTVTGQEVRINYKRHLLIAAISGAGKSVTARPILADICADPLACFIYIDPKRVEASLWEGRARLARDSDEIYDVAVDLDGEYERRTRIMQQRGWDEWIPSPEDPIIVALVDEGADLVADAADSSQPVHVDEETGAKTKIYKKSLSLFTRGARMWRAAGIFLIWITQYPTVAEGLPSQIGGNMDDRISLRLAKDNHSGVVFGNDMVAQGWKAHQLPKNPKGRALIKAEDREPWAAQVVYLDKSVIPTLPLSGIWYPGGVRYATPITDEPEVQDPPTIELEPVRETLFDGPVEEPEPTLGEELLGDWDDEAETETEPEVARPTEEIVFDTLAAAEGPLTPSELATKTGLSPATIHRKLDYLRNQGLVKKLEYGKWTVAE